MGFARSPSVIWTRTRFGTQPARVAHQAAHLLARRRAAAAAAPSRSGRWLR